MMPSAARAQADWHHKALPMICAACSGFVFAIDFKVHFFRSRRGWLSVVRPCQIFGLVRPLNSCLVRNGAGGVLLGKK